METTKSAVWSAVQPAFYKVTDIQRLLGIGRNAAYTLITTKDFPAIFVGRRIIVPSDLFHEWVKKQAAQRKGGASGNRA